MFPLAGLLDGNSRHRKQRGKHLAPRVHSEPGGREAERCAEAFGAQGLENVPSTTRGAARCWSGDLTVRLLKFDVKGRSPPSVTCRARRVLRRVLFRNRSRGAELQGSEEGRQGRCGKQGEGPLCWYKI